MPLQHRFEAAYDPFKYHQPVALQPQMKECECGAPLIRMVYKLNQKDLCLTCALDEAGIECERVREF